MKFELLLKVNQMSIHLFLRHYSKYSNGYIAPCMYCCARHEQAAVKKAAIVRYGID